MSVSIEDSVSVVVPVYQGERTLDSLFEEMKPMMLGFVTPGGRRARVHEVILAYDNGPDRSDQVIRRLVRDNDAVRAVWLSRNFGQHAATLAGIAQSTGDWIVTLDEDGQHDPRSLVDMLDTAMDTHAPVVYAIGVNPAPHGRVRNAASRGAKRLLEFIFGGVSATDFSSFRLISGEVGRSVAGFAGTGVYLDVALSWVAKEVVTTDVRLREEGDRRSGYSYKKLLAHFWRMILTSGTRGLRAVTALGALFAVGGIAFAAYLTIARIVTGSDAPAGWTSLMVLSAFSTGVVLMALGVIAEYLGVAVNGALGRPSYLISTDPALRPEERE